MCAQKKRARPRNNSGNGLLGIPALSAALRIPWQPIPEPRGGSGIGLDTTAILSRRLATRKRLCGPTGHFSCPGLNQPPQVADTAPPAGQSPPSAAPPIFRGDGGAVSLLQVMIPWYVMECRLGVLRPGGPAVAKRRRSTQHRHTRLSARRAYGRLRMVRFGGEVPPADLGHLATWLTAAALIGWIVL